MPSGCPGYDCCGMDTAILVLNELETEQAATQDHSKDKRIFV